MDGVAVRCLEPEQVLAYVASPESRRAAEVEAHIDACATCRAWVAELARTSLLDSAPSGEVGDVPLGEYLPPKTKVGRYVLRRPLGRGGMAVVYQADDPMLERPVAIKVLRVALAERAMERLLAEARAMARVADPHVRAVYDVGRLGGRAFLALELIDGQTLAQWLKAEPRPLGAVLDVFVAAGRGLAAAHRIGIAHRDFKPSNVLVTAEGRVVVSDFGLAASTEPTAPSGGTPRYMAPEQRAGRGDVRVDQYAFGVALQEALDGMRVPTRVRTVLQRARHADPRRRFRSMDSLLAALRPTKRRRWVTAASVGIAATVGATAMDRGDPPSPPTESAGRAAVADPIDAEVSELDTQARTEFRDGRYDASAATAERALQIALTRGNEPGRALALLERGRARARMGAHDAADADHERAYMVAIAAGREDIAAEVATSRVTLLTSQFGRHDEALTWGRHARVALERNIPGDAELARLDMAMAVAHAATGDWQLAAKKSDAAVAFARSLRPAEDWMLSVALSNGGYYRCEQGEHAEGLADLREGLRVAETIFGPHHTEVARIQTNLASCLKATGGYWEAALLFGEALRTLEVEQGADSGAVAIALINDAANWTEAGEPGRSLAPLRRAAAILGPQHPDVSHVHHNLAIALRQLGRHDEALRAAHRAVLAASAAHGDAHATVVHSLQLVARCALSAGDPTAAATAVQRAADIEDRSGPRSEAVQSLLAEVAARQVATPDAAATAAATVDR